MPDTFRNPDAAAIRALLQSVRTIAVVGLSPNPLRPSHGVARALQQFGYKVIPVRPAVDQVLGERAYPTLSDVAEPFDLVDVFRSPEHIAPLVDECLRLGVKAIWLQDDVVDEAAARRAADAGVTVVMDRCIYRDYNALCRD
ncbi:MAG: CoA-binding protein [Sterolibacteriaceae bacterium]|uniref:CoA-binding protein n=1 Tax=Candidatus Methylophosphatis roskildensis TaxID=2899263 RepID=A0A9D7E236_9PROT|nr:CoA-binding protein [Candidatus Methylophosphatis roskildensis]MBK7235218.1 CoA-binding protein [Sterolibacteriaceae bacterium]